MSYPDGRGPCGPGGAGRHADREEMRRNRRRGPWWAGPWGGEWGSPPWEWGGRPAGPQAGVRAAKVRRGDVRSAILSVVADHDGEQPLNGYQVIQAIGERSRGAWTPSPGSVYPTISQLEDEGLVETVRDRSRKVLRLTEDGRTYVAEHAGALARVWEPFQQEESAERIDVKSTIGQTMGAVWQIVSTGSPEQQRRAVEILADTRRRLYGVLADGPEAADTVDTVDTVDTADTVDTGETVETADDEAEGER